MTALQAKAIAQAYLDSSIITFKPGQLLIDDQWIVEDGGSFVFFYQLREWFEQRDRWAGLSGNLPINVDKTTGVAAYLSLDEVFALNARLKAGGAKRIDDTQPRVNDD